MNGSRGGSSAANWSHNGSMSHDARRARGLHTIMKRQQLHDRWPVPRTSSATPSRDNVGIKLRDL
jgi:hypothetical protein